MPQIIINIDPLLNAATDPLSAMLFLLEHGAWAIFLVFLWWIAKQVWFNHIQGQYVTKNLRPLLLAIDVPKRSVQTPKAVENIFAHLAGIHSGTNRREKYFEGKVQEWFSMEIVSIDGYIQFLVWTWDKYRDLVETAIYAQYPDAQITEVEDYTKAVPHEYPNDEWDLWGTDFVFVKPSAYPLRTWEEFEHKGQKEEAFKDPLAAMLESMARLGPGEQVWIQLLLKPIGQDWQKTSAAVVKKLIGAKAPAAKPSQIGKAVDAVGGVVSAVLQEAVGWAPLGSAEKKPEPESKLIHMTQGERGVVEAIERKSAKIGFEVKIRALYVGRKEAFTKAHGVQAIVGALKQFNSNDLNGLKPDGRVAPTSLWLMKTRRNNARKTNLAKSYSARSMYMGAPSYIMNLEELATFWHFPTEGVHAPLIAKTEAKRAVPPSSLPIDHDRPKPAALEAPAAPAALPAPDEKPFGPPAGLPTV